MIRTADIRSHHPVGNAGTLEQRNLRRGVERWLELSLAESRRERHVAATGIGVHDEDVGTGHLVALTDANPLGRRGPLDLKENITIAAGGGLLGYVDAVADIFSS